jgi:hypothetical protein
MRIKSWTGLPCVLWLALLSLSLHADVVINEVMYHPPGTNVLEEWLELFNRGGVPADLSGWKFTSGVGFTVPAGTVVPAGGFLVVAADVSVFRARHADVTNVIGGWRRTLGDDGDTITLENAAGDVQAALSYGPQGDWAVRRLSEPDRYGRRGWEWYAPHDGLGKSAELVNPALGPANGLNWAPSVADGGTPGRTNSTVAPDVAPLFSELSHFPIVPRSVDPVRFTVRVEDERLSGVSVALQFRNDGEGAFSETPMLDDGAHGDGLPNDGIFGVQIPPRASGTLVEFRLVAIDSSGRTRVYPAVEESAPDRSANPVLQISDEPPAGRQPRYRILLARAEYDYLKATWSGAPNSDAGVNGTLIATDGVLDGGATTQVRYLASFRNRGHGSRTSVPHNIRVDVPKDRPWNDRDSLNLNTQYTQSQLIGGDLMRLAGLPMAESRTAEVRINGVNLALAGSPQFGVYVANESPNGTFVKRQFPDDSSGHLFRGIRDVVPGAKADLAWHGAEPSAYTNAYFPENNVNSPDWSGLIGLLDALNNSSDSEYVNRVSAAADVREWMRYFAINVLMGNEETALATGYGDDYALFAGIRDPRVRLLPYDMDSVLGRGVRSTAMTTGLFPMVGSGANTIPALNRLMKHPEFAPLYYAELVGLADGLFEPAIMNPRIDRLRDSFPEGAALETALASMKAFNAAQVAHVRSLIPRSLAVSNSLPVVSGFPRTTTAQFTLTGVAEAVTTRRVLVNGSPAEWTAWTATWSAPAVPLAPGVNRLLIRSLDASGAETARLVHEVWFDDGSSTAAGGTISGAVTWSAANGPYQVDSTLNIAAGATLNIEPGTVVYLGSGANLVVQAGGRLLAEGTEAAPIHFTRAPGATARWGGIEVIGTIGSPETRITHAHIAFNNATAIHAASGSVFLDHLTFGSTDRQYVSLDASSFVVSHCVFPDATAAFELAHGTGGIRGDGHGLFIRNVFGRTQGYNDVIDFTGGQRPAAIVHFIGNVFAGASDDVLDLDGTDAWVEDNVFLHVHRNGSPDSSSAISGGNDSGNTSQVTVVGNLFYDVDQAATAKQGNFYALLNNTIVRQNHEGSQDAFTAVLNFADDGTTEGAGMYLEENILHDIEALLRNQTAAAVTFTNNLLPTAWTGQGGGNAVGDPLFAHLPTAGETAFDSWEQGRVVAGWLAVREGSPARGAGAGGRDLGGSGNAGPVLIGVPSGTNSLTSASVSIGPRSTVGATYGWPAEFGYPQYRWRLDGGAWSAATPSSEAIQLANLSAGAHRLEVSARRDSGLYQDDPLLGDAATVAVAEWFTDPGYVSPAATAVVLSEVLAHNVATLTSGELTPDYVEIHNRGGSPADLSGIGVTDDITRPYRFVFPAGTILPPGGYLVLLGDSDVASPGVHLGFALKQEGDSVWLVDATANGGAILDSLQFGSQITDLSVGRGRDGFWTLCRPTPGDANRPVPTGDPRGLRINEWLASSLFLYPDDFVELYNSGSQPVALDGLLLTDAAGTLDRHVFPPLSYIAGGGFVALKADDQADPGHLDFRLSREAGLIRLSGADRSLIDAITYPPQRTDVSEGRSPDGSDALASFTVPTPGGPNPGVSPGEPSVVRTTVPVFGFEHVWKYRADAVDQGTAWKETVFDDAAWASGTALFGTETSTPFPYPIPVHTEVPVRAAGNTYVKTGYFRTHFTLTNTTGFQLWATNYLDDGAVFYLNGVRVKSIRVNDDPATYASDASNQPDEGSAEVVELPVADLVAGDNVLAVEVHQSGGNSSDIVFGMSLSAVVTVTNSVGPASMPLRLSEVLVLPSTGGSDASAWVELHNASTNAVAIGGLALSDDPASPAKWVIAEGTVVPPDGFFTVACDVRVQTSATNTGFGLRFSGGELYLFNRASDGSGVLDSVAYGLQTPGFAIGRVEGDEWVLTVPGRGLSNIAAALGSPAALRLNEWLADPVSGSDWFEVFNGDALPVSLAGLAFTDDLARPSRSPVRPLSFIGVGPDGFVQIFADSRPADGANHVAFKLSKDGSDLGIFAANGAVIDQLHFGPQVHGVSGGRLPDGGDVVASLTGGLSPGAPNLARPIDSDGDGLPDSWETANGTDPAVADAGLDPDGDGRTNLEEYRSGTDPRNAASVLRLLVSDSTAPSFSFQRVPGRVYLVQSRDSLDQGVWMDRAEFPAISVTTTATWSDLDPSPARFYRILSTWTP